MNRPVMKSKTLAHILPQSLLEMLGRACDERGWTPQKAQAMLSPSPQAPAGLGRSKLGSLARAREQGLTAVGESHGVKWPRRRSEKGFEGLDVEPLGLPAQHAVYQSSLWEAGGWDGYNTDMVALSFLVFFKGQPKSGLAVNMALLGQYSFEGSLQKLKFKPGQPLRSGGARLDFGVARSMKELGELAKAMDIDGYGERACSGLIESCLSQADAALLFDPQFYEKEALDKAALPANAPTKRARI